MEKNTVGIRELKDQASSIIDQVEEGEAITVTKHGRPGRSNRLDRHSPSPRGPDRRRDRATAARPSLPAPAEGEIARVRDERGRLRHRESALSVYLDTSALVKLLVDEPGADEASEVYCRSDLLLTMDIARVEATSALARMRNGRRLTQAKFARALEDLEMIWHGLHRHAMTDALLGEATDCALQYSLRAYDAMHLAGALSFAAGKELDFACWDKELREAAKHRGLTLVPDHL